MDTALHLCLHDCRLAPALSNMLLWTDVATFYLTVMYCFISLQELPKLVTAGLVLEPLPTGAWAFLAVTAAIFTKTLTFAQAFSAFTNDVIWLIVVSFFFAAVNDARNSLACLLLQGLFVPAAQETSAMGR